MSPRFEAFLARLYVDTSAREQFLRDPEAALAGEDLNEEERAALAAIDRVGLRLAAMSFGKKRGDQPGH